MADIRNKIADQNKRNKFSQVFHAGIDGQTIASWRSDLDRILLVFNVCPVLSARPLLTIRPQTELGLNTYVAVSDVREGVTKTHAVVSEVRRDVTDTHIVVSEVQRNVADTQAMVSDIRRQVLGSQQGADDKNMLVSDARTVPTTNYVLTVSQSQARSANPATNESRILHLYLVYLVNHLPRRRGPVSDAGT